MTKYEKMMKKCKRCGKSITNIEYIRQRKYYCCNCISREYPLTKVGKYD
jgi:hypothetical protein